MIFEKEFIQFSFIVNKFELKIISSTIPNIPIINFYKKYEDSGYLKYKEFKYSAPI